MKVKDLRIGNLVYTPDRCVDEVTDITLESISTLGFGQMYDLEPIPLTEEWLIKFGFINHANEWCNNLFVFEYWERSKLYHFTGGEGVGFGGGFKYVHQLQNLYFALTNEELKLK